MQIDAMTHYGTVHGKVSSEIENLTRTVLDGIIGNGKEKPSRQRVRETSDKLHDKA